jgi:Cu2+-containing amine oxidase
MDRTGGNIHDHTYTFKVDLDVGTPTNTLQTMQFKVSDKVAALNTNLDDHWAACAEIDAGSEFKCDEANKAAWTDADVPYLLFPHSRHVDFQTISTEQDARLNSDPAHPKAWLFGDTTQRNKYGNVKNYRVKLHDIVQGLLPTDHHTMPANSMSLQNMAVTVRKEDEVHVTGDYDLNRFTVGGQSGSQANVDMMSGDESIVQQDLVAWVACTTHHYPNSENVPMTSGIRHGFSLEPFNFFDENPSMDMPSYLRVMADEVSAGERGCPDACEEADPAGFEQVCTPPSIDCTHSFAGVW